MVSARRRPSELLPKVAAETKTLLEVVQAKNTDQGQRPTFRADLHFGRGPAGRVFILNKWDGVVREIVR